METSIETRNAVTVVRVTGSVDGISAPDLQEVFERQIRDGRMRLVADLAGVDYTSSAGLRVLLGAMKDARTLGGDLRLAAPRPDVQRVLEMSGFASILKIFDDVVSAAASYPS
jgi:anti-anti-sigma factor